MACDDLTNIRKTSFDERQAAACEEQISQLSEQRQQYYERFLSNEVDRDTLLSGSSAEIYLIIFCLVLDVSILMS